MTNRRRHAHSYWKLLLACTLAIGTAVAAPRGNQVAPTRSPVQYTQALHPAPAHADATRAH